MTRLSGAEAVLVTDKIKATVDELVKEKSAKTVTTPVIEACAGLVEAAKPLGKPKEVAYEARRQVDNAADRCAGAIYNLCKSTVEAYDQEVIPLTEDQSTELEAARVILRNLFPHGSAFLQSRWAEQYGMTETMLKRAASLDLKPSVERLKLGGLLDLMGKIHAEYGVRMGFDTTPSNGDDTPVDLWHEALETYLAAVFFTHKRDSGLRERLLEPYEDAAAASRASRVEVTE